MTYVAVVSHSSEGTTGTISPVLVRHQAQEGYLPVASQVVGRLKPQSQPQSCTGLEYPF